MTQDTDKKSTLRVQQLTEKAMLALLQGKGVNLDTLDCTSSELFQIRQNIGYVLVSFFSAGPETRQRALGFGAIHGMQLLEKLKLPTGPNNIADNLKKIEKGDKLAE